MTNLSLPLHGRSAGFSLGINLGFAAVLFGGLSLLPVPQLLECSYPASQTLILALGLTLILELGVASRLGLTHRMAFAGMDLGLLLVTFWLGSYQFSPLGFAGATIPLGQGFVLTRAYRTDLQLPSGASVSLVSGSTNGLQTVTLPVAARCTWRSIKGGVFDDSSSCDLAYKPPSNATYDLLTVLIQPSCHLPQSEENLKINVLPP